MVGINGKLWRLVKSWYSTSPGCVRINHHISDKFTISRGVKQGSVLSPTLFLIVMDVLLKRMRESNCGLSIRGTHMGAGIHADDLCTAAPSMESTASQADIIKDFTVDLCLKLNASKVEIVKISTQSHVPESYKSTIPVCRYPALLSASVCDGNKTFWPKCLIAENINKARKAFSPLAVSEHSR